MGPGSELIGARKDVQAPVASTLPASLRLATGEMLERGGGIDNTSNDPDTHQTVSDSTFGVKSLQDTIFEPHSGDNKDHKFPNYDQQLSTKTLGATAEADPAAVNAQKTTLDASPYLASQKQSRQHSASHSLASVSLDSQAPLSSHPSSPKSASNRSLKQLGEDSQDEGGSQAVASSSEDDEQPPIKNPAPQLVMPSITMPSRRPFTERGRNLGRLKILIAGDAGTGKTSLIKSIVQTCDDIVHADPLSSMSPDSPSHIKSKSNTGHIFGKSSPRVNEIYASSRPYPSWWAHGEEAKFLQRRRSSDDTVLERNLCFVDTPGYSHGLSRLQAIEMTVQYVEAQLHKSFPALPGNEADLVGLLSGSGGSQVDLAFYLISQEIRDEDLVFLQRLSGLTNVIPLISKSDTRSPEELEVLRRSLAEQLQLANIQLFASNSENSLQNMYTVCSIPTNDEDTMDASLLMSSEYIQPLVPSELKTLLDHVFDKETISCLRHQASKKLIQARGSSLSSSMSNTLLLSKGGSPYLQAKMTDHMQQEQKIAQVRLAKWASDLQRSLQEERAHFETLAQDERTEWLTEKLKEQDAQQTVDPNNSGTLRSQTGRKRTSTSRSCSNLQVFHLASSHANLLDAGDPLGLLQWNDEMRRRGWIALQVAGGFGILGAVAVWAAKTCGNVFSRAGLGNDEEHWFWGLLASRAR